MKRIIGDNRARLLSKIDSSGGPDACWPFIGARTGQGYGNFYLDGKYVGAHKAVWLVMEGPIPDGLEVDHLCHNRDRGCPGGVTCPHRMCMNWERHLRLATHRENDLAGRTGGGATHCCRGHEFTPENTYVWHNRAGVAKRFCRRCRWKDRPEKGTAPAPVQRPSRMEEVKERRARATQMRADGLTYAQIAERLGYANRAAARNLINGPQNRSSHRT